MKAFNPLRIAVRGLLLCTLIGCGVATADAFSSPDVTIDATTSAAQVEVILAVAE